MTKLNLGCGNDIRGGEWVNLDGFIEHPDVVKHDMLRTPWPFPDNSFDEVYAAHVLEHVPPVFRDYHGTLRDVIFDVMEEIGRVLKPGGRLHMRVPYGPDVTLSMNCVQHYRFWHDNWFSTFRVADEEALAKGAQDFYTSARFDVEAVRFNPMGVRWRERLKIRGHGLTVHLATRSRLLRPLLSSARELEAVLVNAKPASTHAADVA